MRAPRFLQITYYPLCISLLVFSNAFILFLVIKRMLDSYDAAFEVTKPAQKLKVFPTLGMVDLELELDGRLISMQVQPIYATIIYLFEDQGKIMLDNVKSTGFAYGMDIDHLLRFLPHFGCEIDSWTLLDIATKIGVREEALESKIQFWVREGVLRETSRHQYELNEQGHDMDEVSD